MILRIHERASCLRRAHATSQAISALRHCDACPPRHYLEDARPDNKRIELPKPNGGDAQSGAATIGAEAGARHPLRYALRFRYGGAENSAPSPT